ncbi:hypothetical protein CEXT_682321 [Caerostris extrusa]|uniref:Uncharacterized protein n=1 Tax=Caerostris extrusa TaxID=172846 RepID=A0AAV4TMZ3_CAEEX|nr:hypothetical protein CEXT_682321 [Caerostris extrusa]
MPTARCPSTPCAQREVGGEEYGNAILISISSHYRSASIALRDERNTLQGRREYESTLLSSIRNVSVSKSDGSNRPYQDPVWILIQAMFRQWNVVCVRDLRYAAQWNFSLEIS